MSFSLATRLSLASPYANKRPFNQRPTCSSHISTHDSTSTSDLEHPMQASCPVSSYCQASSPCLTSCRSLKLLPQTFCLYVELTLEPADSFTNGLTTINVAAHAEMACRQPRRSLKDFGYKSHQGQGLRAGWLEVKKNRLESFEEKSKLF